MKIEFSDGPPIYRQIMDALIRVIARGSALPADKLPSVREIAQGSVVNPNTVQKAYAELERTGLVVSKRGEGMFVTGDLALIKEVKRRVADESVRDFVRDLTGLGVSPEEVAEMVIAELGRRGRGDSKAALGEAAVEGDSDGVGGDSDSQGRGR